MASPRSAPASEIDQPDSENEQPLLLLIMLMTNNRNSMSDRVNSRGMNIFGWATTVAIFAATAGLVVSWFL